MALPSVARTSTATPVSVARFNAAWKSDSSAAARADRADSTAPRSPSPPLRSGAPGSSGPDVSTRCRRPSAHPCHATTAVAAERTSPGRTAPAVPPCRASSATQVADRASA